MENNTVIFKGKKYGVSYVECNGEYIASILLENMNHIASQAPNKEMAKIFLDAKLFELEEMSNERKLMD